MMSKNVLSYRSFYPSLIAKFREKRKVAGKERERETLFKRKKRIANKYI